MAEKTIESKKVFTTPELVIKEPEEGEQNFMIGFNLYPKPTDKQIETYDTVIPQVLREWGYKISDHPYLINGNQVWEIFSPVTKKQIEKLAKEINQEVRNYSQFKA
jgi:hypothetical protein